jgi:hypothetical protein
MSETRYSIFMPIIFDPWLYYPSLTKERLVAVATLMRDARDGAVLLHDPEAGDTRWSLGCRIYDRIRAHIRRSRLAMPWLSVIPESHPLRFTFTIGDLPLKFYKGEAEDVPGKFLVGSFAELRQMKLVFGPRDAQSTQLLRIAVEPDASGNTSAVSLVEVEESGEAARIYEIPLDAQNVVVMKPKPINLAPVVPEIIEESAEEVKSEEAGDQFGASGTKS